MGSADQVCSGAIAEAANGAAPRGSRHSNEAGHRDFKGDGRDDILWLHESGLVCVWLRNGAVSTFTASGVGNGWTII